MNDQLIGLRDVEGVFGSFVLAESGKLLAKDLPPVFDENLFAETGPRLVRLCEAVEYGGGSIDTLALRFTDHRLHVRRSNGTLLCVITSTDTNASALRMAIALCARRLPRTSADGERASGYPPPAERTPRSLGEPSRSSDSVTLPRGSTPPPGKFGSAAPEHGASRLYRGRPIE